MDLLASIVSDAHSGQALVDLFNSFLLQGSTPDEFSLGFWSAIPKSRAPALKHAVSNKRPISRSFAVGKLFEAVIGRRIREQIEIVEVQGGFTPGRSGLDNMVWLWETLSVLKHDKRYNYRLHLFDFEKAFDTEWLQGPCSKMLQMGVSISMFGLFIVYYPSSVATSTMVSGDRPFSSSLQGWTRALFSARFCIPSSSTT